MNAAARIPGRLSRQTTDAALAGWYLIVVVFLFAPIVLSVVYSFNAGSLGKQTALFTGWTLSWYGAAWRR